MFIASTTSLPGILIFNPGLQGSTVVNLVAFCVQAIIFLFWSFFVCLCMIFFNSLHDIKSKAFLEKVFKSQRTEVLHHKAHHIHAKKHASNTKKMFMLLHKACEGHVMMNVIFFTSLIEVFLIGLNFRALLFTFYGLAIPVLAITKLTHAILSDSLNCEFDAHFKTEPS